MHILLNSGKNTLDHEKKFAAYPGIWPVLYDMDRSQLVNRVNLEQNKTNKDWGTIKKGDLICRIDKHLIAAVYVVRDIEELDTNEQTSVIRGDCIAHFTDRRKYSDVLREFNVVNPCITKNFNFRFGANVINLATTLDSLPVVIDNTLSEYRGLTGKTFTLGELKLIAQNLLSAQQSLNLYPDEIPPFAGYFEGLPKKVYVNIYERNAKAREECIAHYGLDCQVCKTNLGATYGAAGKGLIHVHHVVQLSDIKQDYEVDPIKDLIPVCPNCHAVIHRVNPPYTIDEARAMLKSINQGTALSTKTLK